MNIRCLRSPPGGVVSQGSIHAPGRKDYPNLTSLPRHEAAVEFELRVSIHKVRRHENPRRMISWVEDGKFWIDYVTDLEYTG